MSTGKNLTWLIVAISLVKAVATVAHAVTNNTFIEAFALVAALNAKRNTEHVRTSCDCLIDCVNFIEHF